MKPFFSVIIPCLNSQRYIDRCLRSILLSDFNSFEIIVVNDGSTDNSKKFLQEYKGKIRLFNFKKNKGPAARRNFAANKAKGKHLVFFDIDTQIDKNCLSAFKEAIDSTAHAGAFQAKIYDGNSKKLETAGHFISIFGFPYEIGTGTSPRRFNQKQEVFGARSAAMVVNNELFQKVGGFDSDYLIYSEETDLSWRIRLTGKKIFFLPTAKVRHFQKSSLSKKTSDRIFFQGARNGLITIIKNAPILVICWMIPLYCLAWLTISIRLLFKGEAEQAKICLQGLFAGFRQTKRTLKKKKHLKQKLELKRLYLPEGIFGKIDFVSLIKKGFSWLSNV